MTDGPGFGEAEVFQAVRALHETGHLTITPEMILEELSPGHLQASDTADFDLVYPSVHNILVKAGRDGTLPVVESGVTVNVIFSE